MYLVWSWNLTACKFQWSVAAVLVQNLQYSRDSENCNSDVSDNSSRQTWQPMCGQYILCTCPQFSEIRHGLSETCSESWSTWPGFSVWMVLSCGDCKHYVIMSKLQAVFCPRFRYQVLEVLCSEQSSEYLCSCDQDSELRSNNVRTGSTATDNHCYWCMLLTVRKRLVHDSNVYGTIRGSPRVKNLTTDSYIYIYIFTF